MGFCGLAVNNAGLVVGHASACVRGFSVLEEHFIALGGCYVRQRRAVGAEFCEFTHMIISWCVA